MSGHAVAGVWAGVGVAWLVVLAPVVRAGWRWTRRRAAAARCEEERIRAWAGPGVGDVLALPAPAGPAGPGAPAGPGRPGGPAGRAGRVAVAALPAGPVPSVPVLVEERRLRWELARATERLAWDVLVSRHEAAMRALAAGAAAGGVGV